MTLRVPHPLAFVRPPTIFSPSLSKPTHLLLLSPARSIRHHPLVFFCPSY
jgi:hypothetical protein